MNICIGQLGFSVAFSVNLIFNWTSLHSNDVSAVPAQGIRSLSAMTASSVITFWKAAWLLDPTVSFLTKQKDLIENDKKQT